MFGIGAKIGLLVLASLSTVFANVNSTPPEDFVQSRGIGVGDKLADYALTVHVVLQIHEHPDRETRQRQDLAQVTACQNRVVRDVDRNASAGVRAVVVEGLYAAGSLDQPQPVRVSAIDKAERRQAKWRLAQRSDLFVYGFELPPLNQFAVGIVEDLGQSLDELSGVSSSPGRAAGAARRQSIQEELTRINLWHAGVVPQRSFLALQTALAVALARGEKQVQLVVGREHWTDLVYAANRHDDVRIRLVRYDCAASQG